MRRAKQEPTQFTTDVTKAGAFCSPQSAFRLRAPWLGERTMNISLSELRERGKQVWTFGEACNVYGRQRIEKLYEKERRAGRFVKVFSRIDAEGEPIILYAGLFASDVSGYISETTGASL